MERIKGYLPARAYDNRVFVVRCNNAGDVVDRDGIAPIPLAKPPLAKGDTHQWSGYSMVADPNGAIVAESPESDGNGESIVYADLDPQVRLDSIGKPGPDTLLAWRPETYDRRITTPPPGTVDCPHSADGKTADGGWGTKWSGFTVESAAAASADDVGSHSPHNAASDVEAELRYLRRRVSELEGALSATPKL